MREDREDLREDLREDQRLSAVRSGQRNSFVVLHKLTRGGVNVVFPRLRGVQPAPGQGVQPTLGQGVQPTLGQGGQPTRGRRRAGRLCF